MSERRFKILLVEDNAGDARLIQESLSDTAGEPFDLEIADRLAPALRRLSSGGIDALLLDLGLPDSKGQETFDQAKAQAPAVPIIILTGLGDETLALKMVQEGAQDYVAKLNLDGSTLSRAIRYAIARDRADQQIRKFNEELENRVNLRTAELEAANKELEAFSYSVSHDLRAPLRHIDGFSRILLESCRSKLDETEEKCLDRICKAAEQMGNLIDDLLKLARVGQHVLNLRPVSLDSLVEQVRAELEADIQGRQIQWKIAELPRIICDEGLIKQVFGNLIGNAIKYTRRSSDVIIEIGQTLAGDTPAFFVRDNGAGFDMKYADKLFAAFQRLHKATDFEGTGIGLATVTESSNGTVAGSGSKLSPTKARPSISRWNPRHKPSYCGATTKDNLCLADWLCVRPFCTRRRYAQFRTPFVAAIQASHADGFSSYRTAFRR